jgi:hypothetical protein
LDLLLSGRIALLLRGNHLLPSSFALYLLLLPQGLLLLHLLVHALALRLLRIHPLGPLLFKLLLTQILHLLPRVAVATSCLSG